MTYFTFHLIKKLGNWIQKCLEHHISNRPYFSPISIHPRIARAMINLSNCDKNETVIDPFAELEEY